VLGLFPVIDYPGHGKGNHMLKTLFAMLVMIIGSVMSAHAQDHATGPNGLHLEPWLYESSLDMRKDLQAAALAGKDMIVLVEQRGCHYCQAMHEVNFQNEQIVKTITENYLVVQLDLRGSRVVTDFDGRELTEQDLLRKWRASGTPTTIVLSAANPLPISLAQTEAFRLPGYLQPFQHHATLDFFASRKFEEMSFKSYMAERVAVLKTQGIDPDSW